MLSLSPKYLSENGWMKTFRARVFMCKLKMQILIKIGNNNNSNTLSSYPHFFLV